MRLEVKLQQTEEKLMEVENHSKRIAKLNAKWQELSLNKYATVQDMFAQIINHKNLQPEETQLLPGYISDDKRFIHMGRGEWISYDTYLLSMNGVTYKNRKTFPRNVCVGVFGYDFLRKSTVSRKGSNRNGNVKKPTEKLNPNKVLAIKDIYKHFLINELKVDVDEADHESCKVNYIISKKIALIKELYKKAKTNARPLLGENLQEEEQQKRKKNDDDTSEEEGDEKDDYDEDKEEGLEDVDDSDEADVDDQGEKEKESDDNINEEEEETEKESDNDDKDECDEDENEESEEQRETDYNTNEKDEEEEKEDRNI
ncbi:histone chaperone RTT106-like isoform X2 [Leptopilina heterotoma]|uniref:histone chaperone RTT106-like isoform X2 n=1 Tax=Leptopilina heterotoma TaxID=63436 RepID=UPI001CA86466|nr:histone chaperone RTT106-like isoform X2 [Leptopilina heterotoma]